MKKNRLIFYAVFGAFHLFLVFFAFYVEANKNDFGFLTQILKMVTLMKWGAMFGLILLISDVVWSFMTSRELEKEKALLSQENNTLKAKLFDLQEAAKTPPARPSNPNVKG
jgi:hypothetical protein